MHSTGSFLLTVIERTRAYLDEVSLDAKYSNDYLTRHVICPEMVNVMSRLSLNFGNPIRIRHSITLATDTEHYILPPNIGEIYRVAVIDSQNRVTEEWIPRNEFHPRGPSWQVQGNVLSFRPLPAKAETVDIHYIPNGDFLPHYSSNGGQLNTTSTFTFGATPDLGDIDMRENAYAGAILRLWDASGVLEERIVESYSASGKQVTVRNPFTFGTGSEMKYEIAPVGINSLYQAISCASAMNLGTIRNITQKQMQFLLVQYKMNMKTIADNLTSIQARIPKGYEKKTVDNKGLLLFGD